MTTLMLCLGGIGIACLVLIFMAAVIVGSREDRYREKIAREDKLVTQKHNELLRRYVGRINQ